MKGIMSIIITTLSLFLLTGCVIDRNMPYAQEPGNDYYYMDNYEFLVGDEVIYELTFPETMYVSKGIYDDVYLFENENDYRVLHNWFMSLLSDDELTKVFEISISDKKTTISVSEGATKDDFNKIEIVPDREEAYINSVNFMLDNGYMFYVNYLEIEFEGETLYLPEQFAPAYEVVYMPNKFDITPGNATYNGVALERRIVNAEYDYNYVYILPFPLVISAGFDNKFVELANGQLSQFNITTLNEIIPSTGNDYRLCSITSEEDKCFRYDSDWYDRRVVIEDYIFEKTVTFYETYYNGKREDESIFYTFNGIDYVIEKETGVSYTMKPVMDFEE